MLICIRIVKLHSVKYLFSVFLKHLYCIRINLCQLLLNNNAAFINSFLNIINIKIRIFLIIKQMHLKSLKQFILIKESYSSPCSMLFSINNNILLIFLDTANLISRLHLHQKPTQFLQVFRCPHVPRQKQPALLPPPRQDKVCQDLHLLGQAE